MLYLPAAPLRRANISACAVGQIISTSLAVSRPLEGRIAIVTDVGRGMRWTLRAAQDERWPEVKCGEIAWSRSPDAGIKLAGDEPADDGG